MSSEDNIIFKHTIGEENDQEKIALLKDNHICTFYSDEGWQHTMRLSDIKSILKVKKMTLTMDNIVEILYIDSMYCY
tara:strand:+ start:1446 stop:1676 length:231 start_codon:yes stop_codon:yes gene_type:complete